MESSERHVVPDLLNILPSFTSQKFKFLVDLVNLATVLHLTCLYKPQECVPKITKIKERNKSRVERYACNGHTHFRFPAHKSG